MLLFVISSCQTEQPTIKYKSVKEIAAKEAAVVTAHPLASEAGLKILQQGGNAVDAAITVQFALAVVYPVAGNIGGGGFMVYSGEEGDMTLDYRETAPSQATEKMYLDDKGEVISRLSLDGHLAAGVPGTVQGMWQAYEKLSKLKDWEALLQPAVDLASGFPISSQQAGLLNHFKIMFDTINGRPTPFTKETPWKEGDLLVQSDLKQTLIRIQKLGAKGFYEGKTADLIVQEMQKGGGLISKQDLADYKAIWRDPISMRYKGHELISMAPPSSGGIALSQLLNSVEPYDLSKYKPLSTEAVHLMTEAERWVYADRAEHLGDSDFYPVPTSNLTDSSYVASRMNGIQMDKARISEDVKAGSFEESEQTTHYSIVDADGNAVSITTTLNAEYGSKTVVQGAGFILNNEMDDFSSRPGVPNLYGLLGSDANKIEAGKRMLSSMTPTIVKKAGKPYIVVGTPGGSTIITSVFQTIVNIIDFDMSALDAVSTPRFHHQWQPDRISYEQGFAARADTSALSKMGHTLRKRSPIGRVEVIIVDKDGLQAAADPRGDDSASGY